MKGFRYLFMVVFGVILFYVGNETLFTIISAQDWIGQRLFFGVGFAGLCMAFLGLMGAYQVAKAKCETTDK